MRPQLFAQPLPTFRIPCCLHNQHRSRIGNYFYEWVKTIWFDLPGTTYTGYLAMCAAINRALGNITSIVCLLMRFVRGKNQKKKHQPCLKYLHSSQLLHFFITFSVRPT